MGVTDNLRKPIIESYRNTEEQIVLIAGDYEESIDRLLD